MAYTSFITIYLSLTIRLSISLLLFLLIHTLPVSHVAVRQRVPNHRLKDESSREKDQGDGEKKTKSEWSGQISREKREKRVMLDPYRRSEIKE